MLKRIAKKIKKIGLSYIYYGNFKNEKNAMLLLSDFSLVPKLKEQVRAQGLHLIEDYVDTKKKSDTIFIFGSGESVNYLTIEQWEEIKKHNTMAFNDFYVHDFVPDYFVTESIRHPVRHEFFNNIAKQKYKEVDMFISYKHCVEGEYDIDTYPFPYNLWLTVTYILPAQTKKDFLKIFTPFEQKEKVSLKNIVCHVSQTNCAISIAMSLGYKNIVLVGVDLNGMPYFTSSNAVESPVYKSNKNYEILNQFRENYRKEEQKNFGKKVESVSIMIPEIVQSWGMIPVDDFICVFNQKILKPKGITLYVSSLKSKLSEFLPVYFK